MLIPDTLICEISISCKLLGYDIHTTSIRMNKCMIEGGKDEKLSQRALVRGTHPQSLYQYYTPGPRMSERERYSARSCTR
jgi:hypothetical protein